MLNETMLSFSESHIAYFSKVQVYELFCDEYIYTTLYHHPTPHPPLPKLKKEHKKTTITILNI